MNGPFFLIWRFRMDDVDLHVLQWELKRLEWSHDIS